MTHPCPNRHDSETADFCSVCGAEILPDAHAPSPTGDPCPNCGEPRASARQTFCEACGHDLRGGARAAPPPAPPALPAPPRVRWDVVVRVDANLYGKPNPDAPLGQPTQTFTLFELENLVGREGTGVRAQVPIRNDPGVSRRHALLIRQPDGSLILRDLNSANGTQLNGSEAVPGADLPMRDGDTIAVGAWTRLAVRAVLS
jgi:hypothetical protein